MNKVITTQASITAGQPIVANAGDGTLPFIQSGIQEAIENLTKGLLKSYTANDVIVFEGLDNFVLTNSGNTLTWPAGSIFYNGEIYTVAAGSVTKSGPQTFVLTLPTNAFSPSLDPVYFKDNIPRSVHQIRRATFIGGTSGSGIADYNGVTVKYYNKSEYGLTGGSVFGVSFVGSGATGTISSSILSYIKKGNLIKLVTQINVNVSASTPGYYNIKITPPAGHKCVPSKTFLIGNDNSTYSSNTPVAIISDSSGDITTSYDNSFPAAVQNYTHFIVVEYDING